MLVPLIAGAIIVPITKIFILIPLFIMLSLLATTFSLSRVADSAGFKKIKGQPGASGAILSGITTAGWSFSENPVAIDQKTMSMVFRGSGRAGVALVSEGKSSSKARQLLVKEAKKVARVLPEVNIITIECGDEKGQVNIRSLRKTILKNKISLTKPELEAVRQRLRALGTFKPPIPKGIDPMNVKVNRKAMRG
jgi:hypothetical protein